MDAHWGKEKIPFLFIKFRKSIATDSFSDHPANRIRGFFPIFAGPPDFLRIGSSHFGVFPL
jgi:hypothetical protein